MSVPILPPAVWQSGTNENSIPANGNALRLEAMNRPCLGVADDAPGGDEDGDVWLVGSAPEGAFASFEENDIAIYKDDGTGAGWHAWAPVDGLRLIVDGDRMVYVGESTNEWQADPSVGGGGGSSGDLIAGTNVSFTGSGAGRLFGSGNLTINASGGGGGGSSANFTVTGTSYTVDPANDSQTGFMTNSAAKSVIVELEATTALPDNFEVNLVNKNATGNMTVIPDGGVTVTPPPGGSLVIPPGGAVTLKRFAADDFNLIGSTV